MDSAAMPKKRYINIYLKSSSHSDVLILYWLLFFLIYTSNPPTSQEVYPNVSEKCVFTELINSLESACVITSPSKLHFLSSIDYEYS